LGLSLFSLIILWILSKYYTDQELMTFDWLYLSCLLVLCIFYFLEGRGIPITRFMGKAFVLIDDEQISLKKRVWYKEQTLFWNEIERIEYEPHKFVFTMTDKSLIPITLGNMNYRFSTEIKEFIMVLGKKKGFQIERLNKFKKD